MDCARLLARRSVRNAYGRGHRHFLLHTDWRLDYYENGGDQICVVPRVVLRMSYLPSA